MMGRSAVNTAIVAWGYAASRDFTVSVHDLWIVGPGKFVIDVAPDWRAFVLGFPLAALMAWGPDIDHAGSTAARVLGRNTSALARKAAGGHRGGMHSAPMIVTIALLTGWLLYNAEWCAWAAGIGWASHIFTDLLTKQGVALFWPLWKKKVRIAWLTTGSRGEVVYNFLILMLGGYIVYEYAILGIDALARSIAA